MKYVKYVGYFILALVCSMIIGGILGWVSYRYSCEYYRAENPADAIPVRCIR